MRLAVKGKLNEKRKNYVKINSNKLVFLLIMIPLFAAIFSFFWGEFYQKILEKFFPVLFVDHLFPFFLSPFIAVL